ncbi:MAG: RidA family protein [Chthoniobacterales bacterium]
MADLVLVRPSNNRGIRYISSNLRKDIMPRQIVATSNAAKPPATYSQAVKAAGLVFVSGTAPHDPVTGAITGTTIQEQTKQCLTNIAAILEAAGSSLDKIVSATVVLAEEDDFPGMNEEWVRWFPAEPPARQGQSFQRASRPEGFHRGDR